MPLIAEKRFLPGISELEWEMSVYRVAQNPVKPPNLQEKDSRVTPEGVPLQRLQLASAGIKYLSAIIRQLVELRNDEESDEYGAYRASQFAFDVASNLLTDAAILLARDKRPIPYGCASTSPDGGIRIEWVRPTRSVHMVIPTSEHQEGYVYHEIGNDYATEPATSQELASWLREID